MQNSASEKTIRLSLSFRSQIGSPALPYEAQRIARELDIDLGEKISCSTYDCAVTPDFCDKLADNQEIHSWGGSVRFGL